MRTNRRKFLGMAIFGSIAGVAAVKGEVVAGDKPFNQTVTLTVRSDGSGIWDIVDMPKEKQEESGE